MYEEEKKAINHIKWLLHYDTQFKNCVGLTVSIEAIYLETVLNLIEYQQQKIALLENEELGYLQGYEDGKYHKLTGTQIRSENLKENYINQQINHYKNIIEKQQKEIEELKKYDYRNIKIDEHRRLKSAHIPKKKLDLMNTGIAIVESIEDMFKNKAEENYKIFWY